MARAKVSKAYCYLFSKSGFTDEFIKLRKTAQNLVSTGKKFISVTSAGLEKYLGTYTAPVFIERNVKVIRVLG